MSQLPELRGLDARGTPLSIEDLAAIGGGVGLLTLTINECGVSDLTPLAPILGLKTLSADDNEVPDVSALLQWPDLVSVKLNQNPVTSLAGFEIMEELALLEFENTLITDVSPVADNKWFRNGDRFAVRNTGLTEDDCPQVLTLIEKKVNLLTDLECE